MHYTIATDLESFRLASWQAVMNTFDFYSDTYLTSSQQMACESALLDGLEIYRQVGDMTTLLKAALAVPELRGPVVAYLAAWLTPTVR